MKVIYKYILSPSNVPTIAMPLNAQILSVKWVREKICIYALVDHDESETEQRQFEIFGTGHPIPPQSDPIERYFLGTVVNDDQQLVFHIFERRGEVVVHNKIFSQMRVEQCRRNPCFLADFAFDGVFSDGNKFELRIPARDVVIFAQTLLKAYEEDSKLWPEE